MAKIIAFESENLDKRIEERIWNCYKRPNCNCDYCKYRTEMKSRIVDIICDDILAYEKSNKCKFCGWDVKKILFDAIMEIKQMEDSN